MIYYQRDGMDLITKTLQIKIKECTTQSKWKNYNLSSISPKSTIKKGLPHMAASPNYQSTALTYKYVLQLILVRDPKKGTNKG